MGGTATRPVNSAQPARDHHAEDLLHPHQPTKFAILDDGHLAQTARVQQTGQFRHWRRSHDADQRRGHHLSHLQIRGYFIRHLMHRDRIPSVRDRDYRGGLLEALATIFGTCITLGPLHNFP